MSSIMMRSVILSAGLLVTGVHAVAQPSMSVLEKAWKEREEKLKSGRIRWVEHEVHARDSMTALVGGEMRGTGREVTGPIPPEDVRTETKTAIIWDGKRMNYSFDGWTLVTETGRYVPATRREVLNSRDSRSLVNSESRGYPAGHITMKSNLISYGFVNIIPFFLWARPLDVANGGIPIKQCRILSERRRVGDRECVVVQKTSGVRTDEWIVDHDRGYIILRYDMRMREQILARIDMEYRDDPAMGLVPAAWHVLHLPGGKVITSDCKIMITDLSVNEAVDEADFELVFPDGAWVNDEVRGVEYISLPGGKERVVTEGERRGDVTYKQIMETESGLAGTSYRPSWRVWLLGIASASLVGSLITFLLQRYRISHMPK